MKTKHFVYLIIPLSIFFAFFTSDANAAAYRYCGLSAKGSNDGTSWDNQWSCTGNSSIDTNMASLAASQPAYLFIDGGSTSQIYTNALTGGAWTGSGSSNTNRIFITTGVVAQQIGAPGTHTEHTGQVIFDGQLSVAKPINITNSNYITIDGLSIQNAAYCPAGGEQSGIYIYGGSNATVKNCKVYHSQSRGIFVDSHQNFTLQSTIIDTKVTNTGGENDNLFMMDGGGGSPGHIIGGQAGKGNYFYKRKTGGLYIDGIQTYRVNGPMNISYNYFGDEGSVSSGHSMHIQIERGSGVFNVYNNVIFNGSGNVHDPPVVFDTDGTVYFEHNTLVCMDSHGISHLSGGQAYMRNNILQAGGDHHIYDCYTTPPTANWSYDLFYHPSGSGVTLLNFADSSMNWSQLLSAGYEKVGGITVGKFGNPLFTNVSNRDFTLQASSPAINMGGIPRLSITDDYAGNLRVAPFDAGAYEYVSGGGDTTPPAAPTGIKVS